MGQSCSGQDANKLQIMTSTNQHAFKNLQKYPQQIPPKSFAVLANQIPKINQKMESILQNIYDTQINIRRNRRSSMGQAVQFPWFFIVHKASYYKGQWKNHLPNGKGQVYFDNGSYYVGDFKDGQAESQDGIFIFKDLSIYRGQIKKSVFNGKGRFQSKSGVVYQGQWKRNLPNGYGIQTFSDGNQYSGQFLDGFKHGKGKFQWSDGKIYEGEFSEGRAHGQGKLYKDKTHKFKGKFQNNKKFESGKMKTSQGTYIGPFVNGLPHDSGVFQWKNHNLKYQGEFNEGRIQGEGVLINKSGKTFHGLWKDGQLIEQFQIKRSRSRQSKSNRTKR